MLRPRNPLSWPAVWPRLGEETGYSALVHRFLGAAEGRLPADLGGYLEFMLEETGLPRSWRGRLEQVLEAFRASVLWAQVQAAAEVHTQVEFAVPAGAQGGVRGVIDLIFRVAGGWKIVDYQSEPVAATFETVHKELLKRRGDDPRGLYWGRSTIYMVLRGLGVEQGGGGRPGTRERPERVIPRRTTTNLIAYYSPQGDEP